MDKKIRLLIEKYKRSNLKAAIFDH